MEFLFPLLLTAHILIGLAVIGLVLLQHGKGADMGAAFGGGSSGSLFGASGSANFLSRTTAVFATIFFLTSLSLSYLSGMRPKPASSVMEAPLGSAGMAGEGSSGIPAAPPAPVIPAPLPVPGGLPGKSAVPVAPVSGGTQVPAAKSGDVRTDDAGKAPQPPSVHSGSAADSAGGGAAAATAPAEKSTEASPAEKPKAKAKTKPKQPRSAKAKEKKSGAKKPAAGKQN